MRRNYFKVVIEGICISQQKSFTLQLKLILSPFKNIVKENDSKTMSTRNEGGCKCHHPTSLYIKKKTAVVDDMIP